MIRIVTYNVGGAVDPGSAAAVIGDLEADVVCVQEAPGRLPLRRLARRSGLEVAARGGRRPVRLGVLIGPRVRLVSSDVHPLRELPGLPGRTVVQAILGVGRVRFAVFALQLGLRPDVRSVHADDLVGILGRVTAPAVACADLNEGPGGPAGLRLADRLVDAYAVAGEGPGATFPNPDPLLRKDYVLVDPSLAVVRSFVPAADPVSVASHHRPVVADLEEMAEAEVAA